MCPHPAHLLGVVCQDGVEVVRASGGHDELQSLALANLHHSSEHPGVVVTRTQSCYGHRLET